METMMWMLVGGGAAIAIAIAVATYWTWRLKDKPQPRLKPMRLRVGAEAEIEGALEAGLDHPVWHAVLALLDEKIIEVSDRPLDEAMNDQAVRFHLGGQAALLEFKEDLVEREREARVRRVEGKA